MSNICLFGVKAPTLRLTVRCQSFLVLFLRIVLNFKIVVGKFELETGNATVLGIGGGVA